MVGGLVTPPLLLAGPAGAALGTEAQQYLVSACLIWCAFGTALQVSRHKIWKTKYYVGTGLISVTGTSFAFTNVALSYLAQAVSGLDVDHTDISMRMELAQCRRTARQSYLVRESLVPFWAQLR
jgi:xanthine/uracil permease